jgi:hypothetical protein
MITLKLDTKALENLMKDEDGQFKLELQQAVLEEFGRRHIKAFVSDGPFKDNLERIKKEAINEINAKFGEWKSSGMSGQKFVLNQSIRDAIQIYAKTVVTYELTEAENHVAEIYRNTAITIKERYEEKTAQIKRDLERYVTHLEQQTETMKTKLLTEQVDGILRNHIKSILAESFAVTVN